LRDSSKRRSGHVSPRSASLEPDPALVKHSFTTNFISTIDRGLHAKSVVITGASTKQFSKTGLPAGVIANRLGLLPQGS